MRYKVITLEEFDAIVHDEPQRIGICKEQWDTYLCFGEDHPNLCHRRATLTIDGIPVVIAAVSKFTREAIKRKMLSQNLELYELMQPLSRLKVIPLEDDEEYIDYDDIDDYCCYTISERYDNIPAGTTAHVLYNITLKKRDNKPAKWLLQGIYTIPHVEGWKMPRFAITLNIDQETGKQTDDELENGKGGYLVATEVEY